MNKSVLVILIVAFLFFGCLGGSPEEIKSKSDDSQVRETVTTQVIPQKNTSRPVELFELVSVQPELNTIIFEYTGKESIAKDSFSILVSQGGEPFEVQIRTPSTNLIEPSDSLVVTLDRAIYPRQLLSVRVMSGNTIIFGRDYSEPFAVPSQKTYAVGVVLADSHDQPFQKNMTKDWVVKNVLNGTLSINEWFLRATQGHIRLTGPIISASATDPIFIDSVIEQSASLFVGANASFDADKNGEMDAIIIFVPKGVLTSRIDSDILVRENEVFGGVPVRTLIVSELSENKYEVANVTRALFTSLDFRTYGTPPEVRNGQTTVPLLSTNACQRFGPYDALSDEANLSRPFKINVIRHNFEGTPYKTTGFQWTPSLPLLSAYTRMKLGFSQVIELSIPDARGYTFEVYAQENTTNASIFKLPIKNQEYYLFELRNDPELRALGLDGVVVYKVVDRDPVSIGSSCSNSASDNQVYVLSPGEPTSRRGYVPRGSARPYGENTGIFTFSLENGVNVTIDRQKDDSAALTFINTLIR